MKFLAPAVLLTAFLVTGCSGAEKICPGDQYPVKAVGNETGRTCVDKDKNPPDGYVRYPTGKVPKHVDDEWDVYWRDKIVDKDGRITSA
jgi:hypothetical protein